MKHPGLRRRAGGWFFRSCFALGGASASSGLAAAPASAAEDPPNKASCAQAYESAQESRASGQLQETRQRLAFCARAECPSFVQKDCARWLEEVERELPSVIVSAVGLAPEKAAGVSIKLDGNVVPGALGGTPIALDPGRHELLIEVPGQAPRMRVVMAQQGVQNRPIEIDLGNGAGVSGSGELELDRAESSSPMRPYAYAAWGVGAVGFGMFAVLGTLGRADENALERDCPSVTENENQVAPGICHSTTIDERRSAYEREFTFADVGLVTGIVGAAAGTVLFILSETGTGGADASAEPTSAGVRFDVTPTPGGAYGSVRTTF